MTSNNWDKATGTSLNGYYTQAALVAVLPIRPLQMVVRFLVRVFPQSSSGRAVYTIITIIQFYHKNLHSINITTADVVQYTQMGIQSTYTYTDTKEHTNFLLLD